jgi:mannose-6-phosphate isomerase-like protein (cupin superfamily)
MASIIDRFNDLDKSLEKIKKLSVIVICPEDNPDVTIGVFRCDGYSVSELSSTGYSELKSHSHSQTEIIVVLEGLIQLTIGKEVYKLYQDDSIIIHHDIEHQVTYLEKGRILSVLSPIERVVNV